MANFKKVNKEIKNTFPNLDIEVVRGNGYVYFDGVDGFDKVESIYTNPTTTETETLLKLCIESIIDHQGQLG